MNIGIEEHAVAGQLAPEAWAQLRWHVTKTAVVRFRAAQRLSLQNRLAQWMIALASIILVGLPLADVFFAVSQVTTPERKVLEVLLGVLVLVLSLLISIENYAVRSERMHTCGLELNRIKRLMAAYSDQEVDGRIYRQFAQDYSAILSVYENHTTLDYVLASFQEPNHSVSKKARLGLHIVYGYTLCLFPYLAVVAAGIFYWRHVL